MDRSSNHKRDIVWLLDLYLLSCQSRMVWESLADRCLPGIYFIQHIHASFHNPPHVHVVVEGVDRFNIQSRPIDSFNDTIVSMAYSDNSSYKRTLVRDDRKGFPKKASILPGIERRHSFS